MDSETSKNFLVSLSQFMQSLCSGYVEFDSCVLVTGHLYLSVDSKSHIEYVINEKFSKSESLNIVPLSNSFHSEQSLEYKVKELVADSQGFLHEKCSDISNFKDLTEVKTEKYDVLLDVKENDLDKASFPSLENKDEDESVSIVAKVIEVQPKRTRKRKATPRKANKPESTDYDNVDADTESPAPTMVQGKVGYVCERLTISGAVCGLALSTPSSYSRHLKTHQGLKPHSCDTCGKSFGRTAHLQRHLLTHTGEKPYSCDSCHMTFVEKYNLLTHKRTHTRDKPYTCDQCGASFGYKPDLKVHYRKHTGERPYSCSVCNKEFADPSNMRKHKKRAHDPTKIKVEGEEDQDEASSGDGKKKRRSRKLGGLPRRFPCDTCGKDFAQKCDLVCHERVHTGEKPYMCETCGKGFTQKINLIGHRRIHTGEKPYPCSICGRSFALSTSLQKHARLHTGEKPYVCELCGDNFRTSSNLTRHRRLKHAYGPKPCKKPKDKKKLDFSSSVKKEDIPVVTQIPIQSGLEHMGSTSLNMDPFPYPQKVEEYMAHQGNTNYGIDYSSRGNYIPESVIRGNVFTVPFGIENMFDPYKRQQFLSEQLNKTEFIPDPS